MKKTVEMVYRAYSKKADSIEKGIITMENIKWVTEHLMLFELTDEELSEMWNAVDEYFTELIAWTENGHVIAWKPYTEEIAFAMDTESAWKEVINLVARNRREQ